VTLVNRGLTLQPGLPPGGETGEVLTKATDTDYDVEWGAGGGSDFIAGKTVANFAALPDAALNSGLLAIVLNSQGVWLINYKAAGLYYSDGATWTYQGDYTLTDQASEIEFAAAGNITATNVQAALTQVDAIKAGLGFTTATTAGTQLVGTLGTNGISMGVPAWLTTAGAGGVAISGGANSQNTGTVNFANSNGITFGLSNNGTMTASHNGLTQQSTQPVAYSAANGSANFSTLSFANSNGVSFSTGTQGLFASHNALTSQSNQALSGANGSFTFQTATFANSNGISFSTGTQGLYASHNALTSQSNQAYSGANGSATFQTISFANSNGVSFSTGTQGLFATVATNYAASDHSHGNPTLNLNNLSGTTASASNGFTLSLSAAAPIPIATQVYDVASAGSTGTVTRYAPEDHRHAGVFRMAAGSNVGTTLGDTAPKHGEWVIAVSGNGTMSGSTGAGGVHTAWISIPNAAASPVGVSAGTTSSNLATINFGDGGGVSFGLNAGTITGSWNSTHSHGNPTLALTNLTGTTASASNGFTLSLSAAAAGGGNTYTQRLQWPPGNLTAVAAMGNGSFSINRIQMYDNVSATRVDVPFLLSVSSSATANTWGLRVTAFACVYTKNGDTLSSLSSGQVQWSTSLASNTAGGTQIIAHAIRPMSVGFNMNFTQGEYYVGFGISTNTSSAGTATTALNQTWSVMGGPIYSSAVPQVGEFTATTNASTGLFGGQGVYSAAISTVPPTVSLSAINQTGSYYARANMGLIFRNI
jgi:hypothetical protein